MEIEIVKQYEEQRKSIGGSNLIHQLSDGTLVIERFVDKKFKLESGMEYMEIIEEIPEGYKESENIIRFGNPERNIKYLLARNKGEIRKTIKHYYTSNREGEYFEAHFDNGDILRLEKKADIFIKNGETPSSEVLYVMLKYGRGKEMEKPTSINADKYIGNPYA
ncbi:hypothetical protein [Fuchsiella alkaliacetigena]|uniref:hypothetical protein n=1 Tax=Fuchsiella alkaliacetigena TaxID=957042 RepID=UPI002009F354|nr:hypothetical protein [Fuchsiella alkaliacetigena]MCK8825259.1 hypothetical protein [Fuchsiella alkaliacetigena]